MSKIGRVILVVVGVILLYLLLLVIMPILTDFASTANTTMTASSNLTNYPGAAEGVLIAPYLLWWAPGVIGMVAVVFILKKP